MLYSDWIPSSVNFCEPDFLHWTWIAEPANTISSLILVLLGFVGLVANHARESAAPCPSTPWANIAFGGLYFLLALVGLGSVALHATLTAVGQALDEIPMLMLSLLLLCTLPELATQNKTLTRPWLPLAYVVGCAITVLIYTTFRSLYSVFLGFYGATVAIIVVWMFRLAVLPGPTPKAESLRRRSTRPLYWAAILAYLGCGLVAWVMDFILCDSVSQFLLGSMVLHPLWHFGAGVGTWLAIQVLACSRAERRDLRVKLLWLWWCLPFVKYQSPVE